MCFSFYNYDENKKECECVHIRVFSHRIDFHLDLKSFIFDYLLTLTAAAAERNTTTSFGSTTSAGPGSDIS